MGISFTVHDVFTSINSPLNLGEET